MKPKLVFQAVTVGVGMALLFAAQSSNADEPKQKHHARTEKHEENTDVPAKADRSGQIATRDGKHSTSAEGGVVGGANGRETRVPTGSQIPQTYRRQAYTTNGSGDTYIYDHNDQRLQQSINVGDSLRSVPGVTVRGGR